MSEEAPRALPWHAGAERILDALCGMVPEQVRSLAQLAARDETELAARERGGESVLADDVVRGWIRSTPPEQRDSLVPVIEQLGYDPLDFEDELASAAAWDEQEEPEG